jgi:hypothetical protein
MQEKESAGARLSGASPSRGGLRISTPICRTSHRLPRLVADVIGPATREVCAVRVGSAGSANCDIAQELVSAFENLAKSLQNLHRGFDSRRRLSGNTGRFARNAAARSS